MNVGTPPSAVLGALLSLGAAKVAKLPAGFRKPSQGKHAAQTRKNKPIYVKLVKHMLGVRLEAGFQKIVIYVLNGEPTHAARQLPDGR